MATANAPALPVRRPALVPKLAAPERHPLPPERIALFGGIAGGLALFVVAGLNVAGVLYTPVQSGEAAGWNPGLDFMSLGLLVMLGPYGFLESRRMARIEAIETRLPDFLRDVAEAGRSGMTLPD